MKRQIKSNNRGFTLVEALVGTTLMVIVFLGIFGAYRLGVKVITLSKNRVTATAIANSRVETIRNLSYSSLGTVGAVLPEAAGSLEPVETEILNNTVYTITTKVEYAVDEADGTGAADTCDLDYKKADIKVEWGGTHPGSVSISTDVAPENLVQEVDACTSQPGGVLKVTVFDGAGAAVPSPTIKVYDEAGSTLYGSSMPAGGSHAFALAVGTYRVEVSKNSYISARTYSSAEVAVPDSPNPTVLQGYVTSVSLLIDQAASLAVDSISPTGEDYFADPFDDATHISNLDHAQVAAGSLTLAGPVYPANGAAISETIVPADIVAWDELFFDDTVPLGTGATFQLQYYDGAAWVLIPDTDLAGNSAGFASSPVDLEGLDKDTYYQLRIKANLTSSDPNLTPSANAWELSWTTGTGVPVGNAVFQMRGSKTVGEDDEGNPVFKYDEENTLDGTGHLDINNIDGDAYDFSVSTSSSLALISTDPSPQPVSAAPGATTAVKLFLRAQNALLVTVQNDVSFERVFSAAIRLYSVALGYDKTIYTDGNGQSYFAPMQDGTYSLEITAAGYNSYSGTVTVSGESGEIVPIHQIE